MNLKEIKNYEGLYSFDLNSNQVWGHKHKKYLKPSLQKNKYVIILCKNCKRTKVSLEKLIYEVYNGEIPINLYIDNIDNNKLNLIYHLQKLKPIKDYPNYSFDLNTDQVYSHYKNIYLSPQLKDNMYYQIGLCKNGKTKMFLLHRLVYEAYNGEIPENLCIDHIDNNPKNNNISNLRLCNRSENMWNKKISKHNKSTGYKNITLTRFNTYQVCIRKYKNIVYQKNFKTLEEAIINRDIQLKLIHKDFHNLG